MRRSKGLWVVVVAAILWAVAIFGVSLQFSMYPDWRSITCYSAASHNWLARQPLYEGELGLHYFPHFAILHLPFALLPIPLGGLCWRWFSVGLLLTGLERLSRRLDDGDHRRVFAAVSLLCLPAAISSMQSGQANLILAAVLAHAAAGLGDRRWGLGAFWLISAVVIKPLGLVMLGFAGLWYRPLVYRLCAGLLFALAVPFSLAPGGYVLAQYAAAVNNLRECLPASLMQFCDFAGVLKWCGVVVPVASATAIRFVAGLGTLALWLAAARRLDEPERSRTCLGLSAAYLMLFNPMTETNSYVILGPVVAALATHRLLIEASWGSGLAYALVCLGLGSDNYGDAIYHATHPWLKPLLAGVFLIGLCWSVFDRRRSAVPSTQPAATLKAAA